MRNDDDHGGRWAWYRWTTLAFVLLLCVGASAEEDEDDDAEALAARAAQRAAERFLAKDYEGAAAGYGEAIAALDEEIAREEGARAAEIARLGAQKALTSERLAAKVQDILVRQRDLSSRVALHHLGLARSQALLGRAEPACRSLTRAIGHDLARLAEARSDPHLASLREHPDYLDLVFRTDPKNQPFDTGDPLDLAYADQDYRRRLRLDPGDAALATHSPLVEAIWTMAAVRIAEVPDRLDIESYEPLVRLAMIRQKSRGWPYRHSHLFDGGAAIDDLRADAVKRFEARRKAPDAPFRAFVAFFPTVHRGGVAEARELLDFLRDRSARLHHKALNGLVWLLRLHRDEGRPLHGTTLEETKAFLTHAEKEDAAIDAAAARLDA